MGMPEPVKSRIFNLSTWLLGMTFLTAATLKALVLPAFSAQVARYRLLPPDFSDSTAIALLLIEAVLGTFMVLGLFARQVAWAMLLLLGLFVGATLLRWTSLEGTACNCFGSLSGGGPSSILVQDALLACVVLLALAASRSQGGQPQRRRWLRLTTGAAAVTAAAFFARPTASVNALEGPSAGDQIRVFLSASCKHCKESLGKVAELSREPRLPSVKIYIGADNDQQIAEFLSGIRPALVYAPLTFHQLGGLVSLVPTVQIVSGGKVRDEWSARVPSISEVNVAVAALSQGTKRAGPTFPVRSGPYDEDHHQ
jgi:uncharacterized membrane protein YphA (DoxX/SURF4 family)